MSRKYGTKKKRVRLTGDEIHTAATRYMAAAQAHQFASEVCLGHPDAKPSNIEGFFLNAVSFELVLLSVEQSLRLMLLLHHLVIRDDMNHEAHVLYRDMQNRGDYDNSVRRAIIEKLNEAVSTQDVPGVTEKEVLDCLKRHRGSYNIFRYFQLNHQGKLAPEFGFVARDGTILSFLAWALIQVNMDEMKRRKFKVMASVRRIPESEMTDELRAVMERLLSQGQLSSLR